VKHIASQVAVMYLGRIVERADKQTLFAAPRHPYTQALLSAIPVPEPDAGRAQQGRRLLLQGDVPSPTNPPPGCAFHTRCRHARPVCAQDLPALQDEAGHAVACHYWREIEAPVALQGAAPPVNTRLQRLQSAFVT
jgi:oligopeptide/dipeptide ABC transporter ATP-binding protein